MNLGEYKIKILKQIDEFDPSLAPEYTDDEDIINRFNDVIDKAVKFAFRGKSHLKTWNIVRGRSANMITRQKLLYTHMDEDIVFTASKGYAYFFEVDNNCTVEIAEGGTVLETIIHDTHVQSGTWEAFKGVLSATGQEIKIAFKGDGYYNVRNVAIYGARYTEDSLIPDFSVWTKNPIPANLYQIQRVIDENGNGIDYRVVARDLMLPYNVDATVESIYYPDTITLETSDDTEILVPIEIESIIIDKACAYLTQQSNSFDDFTADADTGMQNLDGQTAAARGRVIKLFDF